MAKGRDGTKTYAGKAGTTTCCPDQGGTGPEGDPGGKEYGLGQESWQE